MAPTYVLTYFDVRALGEPIRMLFAYGNIQFEDIRIKQADWPKIKLSMPAGQMPVLDIDGKKLFQSVAITRYLGKLVKLDGANDLEAVEIDMAVDTLHDLRAKVAAAFYEKNETIKENKYKNELPEYITFMLERLEGLAKKNKGHLALGKLTWADFVLAGMGDYLSAICRRDIYAGNPNLKAIYDKVNSIPQVKAWKAKSPKTELDF